jgi:hypothetical protein
VDPPADAHTVRPAAHCPSNAIVSVPQREGEGIAERVEEEEIREREIVVVDKGFGEKASPSFYPPRERLRLGHL